MAVTYRAGVDIGGTFTDIVLLGSDGTVHTKKISSSVGNYAQAIVDGLSEVFTETGVIIAQDLPQFGDDDFNEQAVAAQRIRIPRHALEDILRALRIGGLLFTGAQRGAERCCFLYVTERHRCPGRLASFGI